MSFTDVFPRKKPRTQREKDPEPPVRHLSRPPNDPQTGENPTEIRPAEPETGIVSRPIKKIHETPPASVELLPVQMTEDSEREKPPEHPRGKDSGMTTPPTAPGYSKCILIFGLVIVFGVLFFVLLFPGFAINVATTDPNPQVTPISAALSCPEGSQIFSTSQGRCCPDGYPYYYYGTCNAQPKPNPKEIQNIPEDSGTYSGSSSSGSVNTKFVFTFSGSNGYTCTWNNPSGVQMHTSKYLYGNSELVAPIDVNHPQMQCLYSDIGATMTMRIYSNGKLVKSETCDSGVFCSIP